MSEELYVHIRKGDLTMVIDYLSQGAKVNSNALLVASRHGHVNIVKFLLKIGFTADAYILTETINNKHYTVVDEFISRGYDLNMDENIILELHLTRDSAELESVIYLINKGAIITNMHVVNALEECSIEVFSFLLEKSDL